MRNFESYCRVLLDLFSFEGVQKWTKRINIQELLYQGHFAVIGMFIALCVGSVNQVNVSILLADTVSAMNSSVPALKEHEIKLRRERDCITGLMYWFVDAFSFLYGVGAALVKQIH